MPKLYSIQYLRALAALAVVLFHAAPNEAWQGAVRIGASGVDIFFVISGFIIWIVTSQKPVGVGDFAWNRIVRIVPLYWSATLLLAAMVCLLPSSFPRQVFNWSHLAQSLLFVPHANPVDGSLAPVIAQGWTLVYEVFFYALFAVSLALPRGARLVALTSVLGLLAAAGFLWHPQSLPGAVYTGNLLLEFALGLMIARLWEQGWARSTPVGLVAIGLGIAGFALSRLADFNKPEVLASGIPAALLVYGCLSIESILPRWRLPERLGTGSYSIYIWHGFVIAVITKLGFAAHLPGLAFVVAALALSSLAGVISYAVIEAPSLRWLKALASGGRARKKVRYAVAVNAAE